MLIALVEEFFKDGDRGWKAEMKRMLRLIWKRHLNESWKQKWDRKYREKPNLARRAYWSRFSDMKEAETTAFNHVNCRSVTIVAFSILRKSSSLCIDFKQAKRKTSFFGVSRRLSGNCSQLMISDYAFFFIFVLYIYIFFIFLFHFDEKVTQFRISHDFVKKIKEYQKRCWYCWNFSSFCSWMIYLLLLSWHPVYPFFEWIWYFHWTIYCTIMKSEAKINDLERLSFSKWDTSLDWLKV